MYFRRRPSRPLPRDDCAAVSAAGSIDHRAEPLSNIPSGYLICRISLRACRASIDDVVDADPVAVCVREIMAKRSTWSGTAADLLRVGAGRSGDGRFDGCTGWPKSPRELAGQLRRAQTFLRALGIDIAFAREGRAGNRVIRIRVMRETVSTVSNIRHNGCQWGSDQSPPAPTGAVPRRPSAS